MSCEGSRKERLRAESHGEGGRIFGSPFIGQRNSAVGRGADEGLASHPRWVESHLLLMKMEGRDDVWREGRGVNRDGSDPPASSGNSFNGRI